MSTFDRKAFFDALRASTLFGHSLSQRQVKGMEAILDAWDTTGYADLRWLAYALGTTYHETGRAMFPVREGALGKGHPYARPNAAGQVGYGRGFVQLTWDKNYAKADVALGLNGALIADYDKALEIGIAAPILLIGMHDAWFTEFRFADYLNDHVADYLHARKIVNGMDKADLIAGYALVFWAAIVAGEHKAGDSSSVALPTPVPPAPIPASPPAPTTDDDPFGTLASIGSAILGPLASILPGSGAPSAAPSTESSTASFTETISIMEQLPLIIAGIKTFVAYLPTIEKFASFVPQLLPKAEKLLADLRKMDVTASLADVHDLIETGLSIEGELKVTVADVADAVSSAADKGPAPRPAS